VARPRWFRQDGSGGFVRSLILNAFDVDPGAGERTLELHCVSASRLGMASDLLVLAVGTEAVPDPTEPLAALGLSSVQPSELLDFRGNGINAWVSDELPPLSNGLLSPGTAFQRLAVLEDPLFSTEASWTPWPTFRQLFCLLAILPLHGLHCPVVAMSLAGLCDGSREAQAIFEDLLECVRNGFRHVPDLERLILFDEEPDALELLADRIDTELGRNVSDRQLLTMPHSEALIAELSAQLSVFSSRCGIDSISSDVNELQHLLAATSITPVALGMHCRRLVERLVRHQLGGRSIGLYRGLRCLAEQGVNPWAISCLHQVRVFGNWMGHPSEPEHRQTVTELDLIATLTALHRGLEAFPWV
jgi:hypothetical protein